MRHAVEGSIDAKTKRQARDLQALLRLLLEPPAEGAMLPDAELSPREMKVLMLLGDRGEIIMTDLAERTGAPLSTLTRVVDRLALKGFAERVRHDEDRRVVIVKPTEKSKALHETFRQHQFELACRMLEPLSSGEREILLELMGKMVRALPQK